MINKARALKKLKREVGKKTFPTELKPTTKPKYLGVVNPVRDKLIRQFIKGQKKEYNMPKYILDNLIEGNNPQIEIESEELV